MLKLPALIQVVHRIHEWMEEKLQTYFRRDTECLNHNIWMVSCMLIGSCCCWFLVYLVCFFDGFYRTWYLYCFCSGCMCTSRFTTFTYWTSLTKGNERRRSTLSRVYNCGIYLFSFLIKEMKFETKKACSSRIGWTVSRPPMTYRDIHNILVFQVWNNDKLLEGRT